MEQRIQLQHPKGKHAVSMDAHKYRMIRKAILQSLKQAGELTHKEMLKSITASFRKNKIRFEGSVEWYMESVKLDLEAKDLVVRSGQESPQKYTLSGQ